MAKAKRLKPSAFFLKAADVITKEGGHGCCHAICRTANNGDYMNEMMTLFRDHFEPGDGRGYWWGTLSDPVAQGERILALLFMSAICVSMRK